MVRTALITLIRFRRQSVARGVASYRLAPCRLFLAKARSPRAGPPTQKASGPLLGPLALCRPACCLLIAAASLSLPAYAFDYFEHRYLVITAYKAAHEKVIAKYQDPQFNHALDEAGKSLGFDTRIEAQRFG